MCRPNDGPLERFIILLMFPLAGGAHDPKSFEFSYENRKVDDIGAVDELEKSRRLCGGFCCCCCSWGWKLGTVGRLYSFRSIGRHQDLWCVIRWLGAFVGRQKMCLGSQLRVSSHHQRCPKEKENLSWMFVPRLSRAGWCSWGFCIWETRRGDGGGGGLCCGCVFTVGVCVCVCVREG